MNSRKTRFPQSDLEIDNCFRKKKIIPYISGEIGDIDSLAQAAVVFVHVDELNQLEAALAPFCENPLEDVVLMLHLDLVRGLARDDAALRYIAGFERIDGIITVHHHLAVPARKLGLLSIVRLFLQDTRAVERGISVIEKSKPDAIELLPCVAAIEAAPRFKNLTLPRIAGGLAYNLNTIQRVLDSGCCAVSVSNPEFWAFNAEF